jgi:hypothetical protein
VPHDLPELDQLHALIDRLGDDAWVEQLAEIEHHGLRVPILAVMIGAREPTAPTFALVGGVHGLERIGTQVVLAYLTTLASLLQWDGMLRAGLTRCRIALLPMVNPVGIALQRRSNGNGVDLMRNAPCVGGLATPLVGGHRWSARLPWFRGPKGGPMEAETLALCEFVRRWVSCASASILVDVHSGFGLIDRLWFPWARTRRPIPQLAEVLALANLVDATLPNHVYRIEPQASSYTALGDVWDHLYDEQQRLREDQPFLPFTLELGSWMWIKKNPRQLVRPLGWFDPMQPHRQQRTLRRHLALFDVLQRASAAPAAWSGHDGPTRSAMTRAAFARWYGR